MAKKQSNKQGKKQCVFHSEAADLISKAAIALREVKVDVITSESVVARVTKIGDLLCKIGNQITKNAERKAKNEQRDTERQKKTEEKAKTLAAKIAKMQAALEKISA